MNTSLLLSRRHVLGQLLALGALPALAADALPASSVYRLDVPLTDQDGHRLHLPELRGEPLLVSMFYTSCEMVCPMIFETLQFTLDKAGPAARQRTRVLMVSFDPARDDAAALKKAAQAHHADARWTVAVPDEAGARKIAAVLGVQYRRLASGEFNHSTRILLLDRDGRVNAHSDVLGKADPALVRAVRTLAA